MQTAFFFAYGTLMRGECRHHYLEGRCAFDRNASTAGTLVDLGEYPGLVLPGTRTVHGELFNMFNPDQLLLELDAMEGSEYERVLIEVEGAQAWVYRVRHPGEAPLIPSGDWRMYQKERSKTATATRPWE